MYSESPLVFSSSQESFVNVPNFRRMNPAPQTNTHTLKFRFPSDYGRLTLRYLRIRSHVYIGQEGVLGPLQRSFISQGTCTRFVSNYSSIR